MKDNKADRMKKLDATLIRGFLAVLCLGLFTGASSQDVALEKVSVEQKAQITALQKSMVRAKIQFKNEIETADAENLSASQKLRENEDLAASLEESVNQIKSEFETLKTHPPERFDQMTFSRGNAFVGQVVSFANDQLTIRSASGEEKTGPLAMMESIDFHMTGLEIQDFPEVVKKTTTTRRSAHAQTMAKFNPSLIQLIVSRGPQNLDDGVTKKGSSWKVDDASEDVTIQINIVYRNPQAYLKGSTLEVMALGRDLENKKLGEVIIRQDFEMEPIGPNGIEVATHTKRIEYWDNRYTSNPHGIDYYSYLVVLKDADGKVLYTKGTRSSIEKLYSELSRLSSGDSFSY